MVMRPLLAPIPATCHPVPDIPEDPKALRRLRAGRSGEAVESKASPGAAGDWRAGPGKTMAQGHEELGWLEKAPKAPAQSM